MDCDEIFIDTVNDTTFKRGIFNAIVAPRPIGWISTVDVDGAPNLAPYSYFNAISDSPKLVMFSSSGYKHSARNAVETGVFTASLAGRQDLEAVG